MNLATIPCSSLAAHSVSSGEREARLKRSSAPASFPRSASCTRVPYSAASIPLEVSSRFSSEPSPPFSLPSVLSSRAEGSTNSTLGSGRTRAAGVRSSPSGTTHGRTGSRERPPPAASNVSSDRAYRPSSSNGIVPASASAMPSPFSVSANQSRLSLSIGSQAPSFFLPPRTTRWSLALVAAT